MSDTLTGRASHLVEIRRSRFLAQAAPVGTPGEAMDALGEARDAAATHNCWAYRIGDEYRSSDDGEPSGTAGRPILAAIGAQGFDQVAVVVTRWYGGVKLGAGGLARAYGGRQPNACAWRRGGRWWRSPSSSCLACSTILATSMPASPRIPSKSLARLSARPACNCICGCAPLTATP